MFKHLKDRNVPYLSHFKIALATAVQLQFAAIALFIHAIIPCCFETTGSNIIRKLADKFK